MERKSRRLPRSTVLAIYEIQDFPLWFRAFVCHVIRILENPIKDNRQILDILDVFNNCVDTVFFIEFQVRIKHVHFFKFKLTNFFRHTKEPAVFPLFLLSKLYSEACLQKSNIVQLEFLSNYQSS